MASSTVLEEDGCSVVEVLVGVVWVVLGGGTWVDEVVDGLVTGEVSAVVEVELKAVVDDALELETLLPLSLPSRASKTSSARARRSDWEKKSAREKSVRTRAADVRRQRMSRATGRGGGGRERAGRAAWTSTATAWTETVICKGRERKDRIREEI